MPPAVRKLHCLALQSEQAGFQKPRQWQLCAASLVPTVVHTTIFFVTELYTSVRTACQCRPQLPAGMTVCDCTVL